ncbi:hypothetical protein JZ751_000387 [Albula glossodonta]|uniref:Sushi domain-containing protein 5 n=1 Tax=Albula glossodonta TaxID=121402 RepID=A0A8T2PVZ8_9TELE|nr:hypothetical protein JZ751_000387 [Albula glossodonta]
MARNFNRILFFFRLFGCLTWLTITTAHADGRVFLFESGNLTVTDERMAQRACSSHGARLASEDELRHAVTECSFSVCTRGWLAGPSIGTTVCSDMGGSQKGMKAMDVLVENATTVSSHMDVFCIKDNGDQCGDPPSFPHTTLQGHTGFEMGDELLYTCVLGYVMPDGRTTFSLLCDSCGVWYGLVQLCVKDETEAHIDYEDKFPDDSHVSYEDPETDHDSDHEEIQFSDDVHESEELEHAEEEDVEQVGMEQEVAAHGALDYEGMEKDDIAHEGADDEGVEEEDVVHETIHGEGIDYEGVEQGGVTHEGVDYEGVVQQGVAHQEEDVEQELHDRPGEEMSVTEGEQQQERGAEESRDVVEDKVDEAVEVDESTDRGSQQPTTVTDAPVSLLSQKHLFWFPSETFHEAAGPEDKEEEPTEGRESAPAEGDNHIGVKASGIDTEVTAVHHEPDDIIVHLPTREPQNDTREGAVESVASSDESWLDGYPIITQEAEKDRHDKEKVGAGSTGIGEEEEEEEDEDEVGRATDSPNHVEIGQPDASSSTESTDVTQIVASPTHPVDYGIKDVPMVLAPTSTPENVSSSAEELWPEFTTAPSLVEQPDATTADDSAAIPDSAVQDRGATVAPTAPWETTDSLYPFLDHLPVPVDQEDVTAPYHDQEGATGSPDEFAGTGLYDDRAESNLTHEGTGAKLLPTEEPCVGDACPVGAGRGPVIAIIIVAICALITAAAVAVWCYKKRQQKSSVYKMNGKGQSRHPQQIEMQQKV